MGTSNFHKRNASSYFVFGLDCEDHWDYEMELETVIRILTESGFDIVGGKTYDGETLAQMGTEVKFGDGHFYIRLDVILRSGYYEGASLDWDIEYEHDCGNTTDYDYFDEQFVADCLMDYDHNIGLVKIHSGNVHGKIQMATDELIERAEKVLAKATTELVCTARFSNGEAWYAEKGAV